jgi:hypothetical protein
MIVCHNNLEIDELKTLSTANVVLHEQKQDQLPYPVGTTGWKLLPPRLRLDAHELWLDNDVVLCNRLPAIDAWLSSRTGIITGCLYSLYGKYSEHVQSHIPVCAGVFGLPPFFDFESRILHLCKEVLTGTPLDKPFDEQGLVAAVVTNIPGFICVPMNEIMICKKDFVPAKGVHFSGTNRGVTPSWETYKRQLGKDSPCS